MNEPILQSQQTLSYLQPSTSPHEKAPSDDAEKGYSELTPAARSLQCEPKTTMTGFQHTAERPKRQSLGADSLYACLLLAPIFVSIIIGLLAFLTTDEAVTPSDKAGVVFLYLLAMSIGGPVLALSWLVVLQHCFHRAFGPPTTIWQARWFNIWALYLTTPVLLLFLTLLEKLSRDCGAGGLSRCLL